MAMDIYLQFAITVRVVVFNDFEDCLLDILATDGATKFGAEHLEQLWWFCISHIDSEHDQAGSGRMKWIWD